MRKVYTIVLLTITIVSCQTKFPLSEQQPAIETEIADELTTKATASQIDSSITFLNDEDFLKLSEIETLEERFQFCDVSKGIAQKLTTKALVESIVEYPLNYLIFAYDNPLSAVSLILENSQLHQELLSRGDVVEKLIGLFSMSEISFDKKTNTCDSLLFLPYKDEMLLENLLLYAIRKKGINSNIRQLLLDEVNAKLNDRISQKETFSDYSLAPLIALKNYLQKNSFIFQGSYRTSTTTIYTPLEHSLTGELRTELSNQEVNDITNAFSQAYQNATVLRPASNVYNCHSYAWHSDDISNNVWLNNYVGSSFQLSLYWTFDLYKNCSESNAQKATYMQSSLYYAHSAVITSSGDYISKWGQGPLMQHSKAYCPYYTYDMNYYRTKYFPSDDIFILGETVVLPGTDQYYRIQNVDWEADPYDYDVNVTYIVDPNQTPFTFTPINQAAQSYNLQCNAYGAYKIRAEYERRPGYLSYGELLVVCVGSMTRQRIQNENVTDLEAFIRDNWECISE